MAIPVEASELENYTPESLLVMGDAAPVFRLKAPSERCVRRFRQLCGDDGLETFSDDEFTAEKIRAIGLYWPEDVAEQYRARLRELIEKDRQAGKAREDGDTGRADGLALSEPELVWLEQLDDQLFDAHPRLRTMRRKTGEFHEYAPRHAMAVYLAGWSGIETPFRLDAGVLAADCISALQRELDKLGKAHSPDAPNLPFLELYVAASKRLRLTEDEEKNSPAPSPDGSTPTASTAAGAPATDGASSGESEAAATSSSNSKKPTSPANG